MTRRFISVLLVALLVATAGCANGGDSGTGPAADGTTSDGTTDGNADPTTAGESASGDATLADNQTAALQDAGSYSSVWRMRLFEDSELVSETAYATAINYADEQYSFEMSMTSNGETQTSAAAYYADGRSYQRFGEGTDANYGSNDADFATVRKSGRTAYVTSAGSLDSFSYDGTQTYDGVTVRRYVMDSAAPWVAAQQQSAGDVRWTDFSYEVLVDGDGVVRAERWSGTGVTDAGVERKMEFTYELTGVGSTTVSEPDWLANATA